jgi:hypothetical protein
MNVFSKVITRGCRTAAAVVVVVVVVVAVVVNKSKGFLDGP